MVGAHVPPVLGAGPKWPEGAFLFLGQAQMAGSAPSCSRGGLRMAEGRPLVFGAGPKWPEGALP
eukprot:3893400-Alexandrium_andersonii.AAC.1